MGTLMSPEADLPTPSSLTLNEAGEEGTTTPPPTAISNVCSSDEGIRSAESSDVMPSADRFIPEVAEANLNEVTVAVGSFRLTLLSMVFTFNVNGCILRPQLLD